MILRLLRELTANVGTLAAALDAEGRLTSDSLQVMEPSLRELDSLLTRALEFFPPPLE